MPAERHTRSSMDPHGVAADGRRSAPSAGRNRAAILAVLAEVLPPTGVVLEVASGTGQHAAAFAPALPHLTWQPSEADAELLASIRAWALATGAANLREPLHLDVRDEPWPVSDLAAVVAVNLLHIAPWEIAEHMLRGAAQGLGADGVLYLYGPYLRDDRPTAPSNLEFDRALRDRDAAWGLRRVQAVVAEAERDRKSVV